jgi:hypothetical protein
MNKKSKNKQKSTFSKRQGLIKAVIRKASLNNFTFPQIIRGTTPDLKAGATTSAAFCFFLNYPSYYRNDAGTLGQMTNTASVLANDQKVNDEYKVLELRLGYIPLLQTSTPISSYPTNAGNSGVTQFGPGWDPSIVSLVDLDDVAMVTSVAKALNAQGVSNVKMRAGNKVVHLMNFPQVDDVDAMKWLNLGAIVPSLTSPPDVNNTAKLSALKVYTGVAVSSQAYPLANTTVGAFLAEWVCLLRGTYTLS